MLLSNGNGKPKTVYRSLFTEYLNFTRARLQRVRRNCLKKSLYRYILISPRFIGLKHLSYHIFRSSAPWHGSDILHVAQFHKLATGSVEYLCNRIFNHTKSEFIAL